MKQWTCVCILVTLAACTTTTSSSGAPDLLQAGELNAPKGGFVPIEPYPARTVVDIAQDGKIVPVDIRLLAQDEVLRLLADTRSSIVVSKVNELGEVSYLTGTVTGEKGSYVAVMDFASFFIDDLVDEEGEKIGRARVGVGLRLIADVQTRSRGIDLGSLLKIGIAASQQKLSGSLEVRAIGVNSAEILSLLPGILPAIDETSIQSALESMAAVKSKIHEDDTVVSPRVMAVELERSSTHVADLKELDVQRMRG